MLESGPGLSGTRKPKYKNPEVQAGFEKGEVILAMHGLQLYDLDPDKHAKVPSNISRQIGSVGAAAALWSGIHADEGSSSPFQKNWPTYGLWSAGRRWKQVFSAKLQVDLMKNVKKEMSYA
tara:strand:+ start:3224 stop:3586 length:363 start_codon:yes stop_codon:yes gene_type:complete